METAADECPERIVPSYLILAYSALNFPVGYRALIFSKWLRSLRYGNDYFKLIDTDSYFENYHRYLEQILARPETIVRIACLADSRDVVLGFSVCHNLTLDFVHVHKDQRRQGIGRKLVPANIRTISHVTKIGLSIWGSKMPGVKFDPFS